LPTNLTAAEVACRLGLRRYPRSWRGRCPLCDYATTFSVRAGRDGRALLFCASCQDRDGLAEAVARATGQEREASRRPDQDKAAERQRKQDRALSLWRGSVPAPGTPADRYLTARGLLSLAASSSLRFRADCLHPEGGRYPALVALVSDRSGSPMAVQSCPVAPVPGLVRDAFCPI
jgi:putative DNA primase/helicase